MIQTARNVKLEAVLQWQTRDAEHIERRFFGRSNLWRDIFPRDLGDRLMQAEAGEWLEQPMAVVELGAVYEARQVLRLKAAQFQRQLRPGTVVVPRVGRFYPRNLLEGVGEIFAQDRRPFRLLAQDQDQIHVDLNHPLATYAGSLRSRITERLPERVEHGGRCIDMIEELTTNGPGMQARLREGETDFFSGEPFARLDGRQDDLFYQTPRLVQHIDSAAIGVVRDIHARFLEPEMAVLDLMSSWVSHLPTDVANLAVTGLGLNAVELEQNPALVARQIHDLNSDPTLPFATASFDAVICSMSVEYLIRPFEIFAEVARVLKPGAAFVLTFSERWFPSKVIQLWLDIHPFERLAVVLDYFRAANLYTELGTETVRGLARPEDDTYAPTQLESDPVYAVWGYRDR
ncbi:MAG: class I SAM-dependent methyltransferase [Gammaproteobacteria bacterium]